MKKYKISAEEFNKVSLTRISNTPSSPSQYNGARLGAEELKKRLDAPLELFRDKLNALVAFLLGEGDDSAVAHISTGIKEGHTISQMLEDIVSESADFASYLSVGEKSLLKRLEEIGKSIDEMGIALGDCIDKNTYEKDIDSIAQDMISHKEAARVAIEALGRDLSDTETELIESIAQALTSAKKYADENKVGKSGDQTINGALSISGNLYVGGNNYAKQMESLEVGDAVIIANADGVLLSELSGYVIRVNEAAAYAIVYDPADDCVKIGLGVYNSNDKVFTFSEGEAQVLATRADIADGNIPEWDNDKKTFRDSGYKVGDFAKKGDVPTSAANALIGSEMGEVVALKDVSPIEHRLGVKVGRANELRYPYYGLISAPSGITFTDNGDGSITLNGTPTERTVFYLFLSQSANDYFSFDEDMYLSDATENAYANGYHIECNCRQQNASGDDYLTDSGNGVKISSGTTIKNIYIVVRSGFTFNNLTIYPQLGREITNSPYKPYIADTSGVKVLVQGANLLSLDKFSWSTNCTLSNGVVTQINADTNTSPTFKIAGNGYAELARSGGISKGRLALEFVCTEQTDNLYFGVHGNTTDTTLYFAGVNLRAGTYTFSCEITNATQGSISWKDMQIEYGGLSEYDPYKEPIEYAYGEDIKSIYPSTTLMTDTEGAVISVEYNRDINKAFEELMKIILSLGGNLYV